MSLVKLPFLISVALGNHIVMTPPQPPPLPEERIKLTGPLVIITWVLPPANVCLSPIHQNKVAELVITPRSSLLPLLCSNRQSFWLTPILLTQSRVGSFLP